MIADEHRGGQAQGLKRSSGMGEILPDGTIQSEYFGLCRKCGKQIFVSMQGQPERCESCERKYQQALKRDTTDLTRQDCMSIMISPDGGAEAEFLT
jgi:hypothetical protein